MKQNAEFVKQNYKTRVDAYNEWNMDEMRSEFIVYTQRKHKV